MNRLKAANRDVPLILRDESDMMRLLSRRIEMIRHEFGDASMRVAFSIGVDATVVVKGYQYLYLEGKVVGGAAPNHIHDVSGKTEEELKRFLKDCIKGKNGDVAGECKMAVVSFQKVPPGMSPYFLLGGLPQTVNDSNDWGKDVMKIADEAAKKVGNAVLLNHSTDGVSCEVQWNLGQQNSFLRGDSNQVALTDTNHIAKTLRYQLFGGSSVACIGKFAVDAWLLKAASELPIDVVEKPPSKETIRWTDWASDALVLGLASPNVVEALLKVKSNDDGNLLVTVLSLVFLRARLYAVNAKDVLWSERAAFTWSSFLWFSSFHTSGSTMLPTKRNMLLETVAVLFLACRGDVSQLRRLTSEANEHFYGMLRQILREFGLEQLIRLVDQVELKTKAIFGSNLATSRDKSGKGYTATFGDFVQSLKSATLKTPPCGPVEVDLADKAVTQLWPHVMSVISQVNEKMIPFLKMFGVTDGNGLSPFAVNIDTPDDLLRLVKDFFRTPKRDPRDYGVGDVVTDNEPDVESEEEEEGEELSDEPVDFVASFVRDMETNTPSTDDVSSDGESVDGDSSEGGTAPSDFEVTALSKERFFDDGDSGKAFLELKGILESSDVPSLGRNAMKMMEMMHLGKSEKGSLLPDGKYKSLSGRWFGSKKQASSSNQPDAAVVASVVKRNSLVVLNVKKGRRITQERYRVLCIFSKSQNKWIVDLDVSEVPFVQNSKNYKIMARMVRKDRNGRVVEVELEKDGQWGPQHVYSMRFLGDIVRVESELEHAMSLWGVS